MKKGFKNISSILEKKNRVDILIYAITFTFSMGALAGCSTAKDITEDIHGQFRAETPNPQTGEILPEYDSYLSETGQLSDDYSIFIEDFTIALYEGKQDIMGKLNESRLNYNEYDSDMKYSDYNKYDSYYMVGESSLGTDESQWMDALLCVYFKDDICVRLSFLKEVPKTALGICINASYSQLIEQYGDSFEKYTYNAHGVYSVYRYFYNDYICEFSIPEDYPDSIQGVDIYVPSLYPIYDYGEEVID